MLVKAHVYCIVPKMSLPKFVDCICFDSFITLYSHLVIHLHAQPYSQVLGRGVKMWNFCTNTPRSNEEHYLQQGK